jgi:hypothetical protein
MISQLTDFISEHKGVATAASMAAVHFAHLAWPKVKAAWPALMAAWPFCKANGGVLGVALTFLFGQKKPKAGPTSSPASQEQHEN